jgi:outer membrane protein assembly factor BamA
LKALNNKCRVTCFGYIFLFLTGLTACAPKAGKQSNSYYLGNSSFKGNRVIPNSELDALIPQKPNRRFLGLPFFPYVGLYRFGELFYQKETHQRKVIDLTQNYQKESAEAANSAKKLDKIQRRYGKKLARAQRRVDEGNFWMRVLGEAPVFFNENDVVKNADKMQKYLYNNGFFENRVTFKTDTAQRRIRVKYLIEEKKPTILRDIDYKVKNKLLDSILAGSAKEARLVPEKRYDGDSFEEERVRIETLLRNKGYYGFSRQYVNYLVNDTISEPKTDSIFKMVDVDVRVDLPKKATNLVPYKIGSVYFEVLSPQNLPDSIFKKDTVEYKSVKYIFSDKRFSTDILNSKLQVKPGELYSQKKERDTQRQLSLTDQFRYVNAPLDSANGKLYVHYKALPLEKYQVSADLGLNVIQLQGAPGPFGNLSYKIRNVFNGLENFEANVRGGIELVPGYVGSGKVNRSQEINVNTSLIFPKLLQPFGIFKSKVEHYNPRTQVGLGYSYVNRPEYTRTNAKLALSYSWQPSPIKLYNLSFIDLNILNTSAIDTSFQSLLNTLQLQGNNLINSFQKSFVSDVNFTYVYNTNPISGPPQDARYFRVAVESGGTSLNLFRKQENLIKNVFGELQFYKYLRLNVDLRKYWRTGARSSFVTRINTGTVYSYGDSKVPPYEKYFFAGGSNSVRGWLPRRLGPGSSAPRITNNKLSIEAPGEFLLEGNAEWRGHLANFFGDINYALFIDAGNVWNINSTATESGKLQANKFFREIAVGSGFGIRYDLSFFVLRFDFGFKVYDPYEQKFVINELNFQKFSNIFDRKRTNFLNINLGVGYPF